MTFGTHTGSTVTYQVDDYYPFGWEINRTPYLPKNEYLYNTKELQEETSVYDYGARQYDPLSARWLQIDPLAELSRRWSPYTYVLDNPIRFIDPDGMENEASGAMASYVNGTYSSALTGNTVTYLAGDSPLLPQNQIATAIEQGVSLGLGLAGFGNSTDGNRAGPVDGQINKKDGTIYSADLKEYVTPEVYRAVQQLKYRWNKQAQDWYNSRGQQERRASEANLNLAQNTITVFYMGLAVAITGGLATEFGIGGTTAVATTSTTFEISADETVVIGKYGSYIEKATELGARYWQTTNWTWGKNLIFLNTIATSGCKIVCSNDAWEATGVFKQEVDYLIDHGYEIATDGMSLFKR